MEIFEFFWAIIIIIVAVTSAAGKNRKKQAQHRQPRTAVPAGSPFGSVPPQPVPVPKAQPSPKAPAKEMLPPRENLPPRPRVAPTIHAHVQPDCAVHDAPGSLGVGSMEGKDPCHEDQLSDQRSPLLRPQTKPGLTLEWTGDAMVKAFVMQEVLQRPCDRFGRR